MKLWKVYFKNGNFTLIWARTWYNEVRSSFTELIFTNSFESANLRKDEVARFNINNIAGFEKCDNLSEARKNDKN